MTQVMLSYSRALLAFLLLLIVQHGGTEQQLPWSGNVPVPRCCAQAATTLQLAGLSSL